MNIHKNYLLYREKYHSNILFTLKSNNVFCFLTFRQLVNYNITVPTCLSKRIRWKTLIFFFEYIKYIHNILLTLCSFEISTLFKSYHPRHFKFFAI